MTISRFWTAIVVCVAILLFDASERAGSETGNQPTVLVTGANRGLGLEFAKQYAAQGYRVIATARNPERSDEADVLAFMTLPKAHRTKIHSTNPLERLNAETKRCTKVVGIFPHEAAIVRLVGALLLEHNDEWQLNRRFMQLEGLQSLAGNSPARLSAVAQ